MYCTFCGDKISANDLTFTEDAEPAHKVCLEKFEEHWEDRDEFFDLIGF